MNEDKSKKSRADDSRYSDQRDSSKRVIPMMFNLGTLHISSDIIPSDKVWGWKRISCMNVPDTKNEMDATRNGWVPVCASKYPQLVGGLLSKREEEMPTNIIKGGLMLCEKPKEIHDAQVSALRKMNHDELHSVRIARGELNDDDRMPMEVNENRVGFSHSK